MGLAGAQLGLDDARDALATVQKALAAIRDNGYRALEVDALTTLAEVHGAQGRPEQGVAAACEALRIGKQTGYRPGWERAQRVLGVAGRRRTTPATSF